VPEHSAQDKQQSAFDVTIIVLTAIIVVASAVNWFHALTSGRRQLSALEAYVAVLENRAAEPRRNPTPNARLGLLAASSRANAQSRVQAIVTQIASETGVRLVAARPGAQQPTNERRTVLNVKLIAQPEMFTRFLVRLHSNRPFLVLDSCHIDASQSDSRGFLAISVQLHAVYKEMR
jgi:hypothetical protein